MQEMIKNVYGDTTAVEFKPEIPFDLGGDQPLDCISAYHITEPVSHWLYVTEGFKQFGFELTFRLKSNNETAPEWPISMLNGLATYVFTQERHLTVGEMIDFKRPLVNQPDCFLTTLMMTEEPKLKSADESVKILQIVPITPDEAMAAKGWLTEKFLKLIEIQIKDGLTDLRRFSLLIQDNIANAIARGRDKDGSDTDSVPSSKIYFNISEPRKARVEFDALAGFHLLSVMPGRIPHEKELHIISPEHNITFIPSDEGMVKGVNDTWVEVYMTPDMYREFYENLEVKRKKFYLSGFDGIEFAVNDTYLRDHEGSISGVQQWR
ncbi:suppressor of fused domain protein [Shewanella baltica]|uniref:suppressor of fused domain protein n=1 Tax=Shewanella baltica TaxID=62322 RepID=UPI0039AEC739